MSFHSPPSLTSGISSSSPPALIVASAEFPVDADLDDLVLGHLDPVLLEQREPLVEDLGAGARGVEVGELVLAEQRADRAGVGLAEGDDVGLDRSPRPIPRSGSESPPRHPAAAEREHRRCQS